MTPPEPPPTLASWRPRSARARDRRSRCARTRSRASTRPSRRSTPSTPSSPSARWRAPRRSTAIADRWRDAPLAGVPVALKDNLCTRGVRTTASSRVLEPFVPPYDATVVERLEQAGAVIVGKTNCDEFAMGSSNENSAFGPVRNPWALDRTPGGTSGGSAASVAARLTPLALGSDTGGSIRQPAAFCGIVGLKPTYGRVSRYGLIAHASSLDQVGPLALTVGDAAVALGAIAGADARDATSAPEPVADYAAALTGDVRGARIGVPSRLLDGVDRGRGARVPRGARRPRGARARRSSTSSCRTRAYAIPVYYLVSTAEASSNLARYDGVRYGIRVGGDQDLRTMYARTRERGFGAEVKRRIMLGTYVLSAGYYDAYYLKAQQVRTLILRDYDEAFARVDAVAMPTSPTPPFKLGERVTDPLQMYLGDVFTVSANLAGLPAVSVPCGFTSPKPGAGPAGEGGLPIGLQLTGRRFDEATLVRLADAYESRHVMVDAGTADRAPLTPPDWAAFSDEQLLALRMCDLGLTLEGSGLDKALARARRRARGARPGVPSALLALGRVVHAGRRAGRRDPVLSRAPAPREARTRADARGRGRRPGVVPAHPAPRSRPRDRQRVPAAAAADEAPALRPRPRRRIPRYYTPKPYSKSFVLHLDHWYAQSHPDEDFAETFAVWLDPQSMWATRYAGLARPAQARIHGPADARGRATGGRRSRRSARSIRSSSIRRTLGEHYRTKREHYGLDHPDFYESDLRNLFSDAPAVREEPVRGALRAAHPQAGARHGGELHRQLPVHDRSAAREDHRAVQGPEPAAHGLGRGDDHRLPGFPDGADDELPA